MRKIHRGDIVKVINGNERGARGEVVQIDAQGRVLVKGVNYITKHQRPTQTQREGGIIEREGTVPISNLMLVCPACDAPTRVGFYVSEAGEKLRQCKQCGEMFE
ncbi:MAG: 50S ribosomal protein L24 [Candidatus Bipolaricaulia bacterium]